MEVCSILAFIGQGVEYKSSKFMSHLYITLVRLYLEYCIQFWSPPYRKDVNDLERVQDRFIHMLPGLVLAIRANKRQLR